MLNRNCGSRASVLRRNWQPKVLTAIVDPFLPTPPVKITPK